MRAEPITVTLACLLLAGFHGCAPVTRTFVSTSGAGGGAASGAGGTGGTLQGKGGGGSDGGSGLTPPFASGTRLHAFVEDASGGAVALEYWQDQLLGLSCSFLPTTDGNIHCVPVSANTLGYSDASCSTKVGLVSACGAASGYIVDQPPQQCRGNPLATLAVPPVTTYALGAKLGVGVVYTLDDATPPSCTVASKSEAYYAITVADPSTFVSATLVKEPRDSRLDAEVLHGSDGSSQLTGQVYDTSMGDLPCSLDFAGSTSDPTYVCIPGGVATLDSTNPQYDDSACTIPIANEPAYSACPTANVVIQDAVPASACSLGSHTYTHVGTDVTAGNVCTPGTTAPCTCKTDTSGTHYFTLGATIDASTFATFTAAKFGTGRVQTVYLADAAGVQLAGAQPDSFWDSMAAASCTLDTFTDGSVRCVPETTLSVYSSDSPVYQDAACTLQLATQYVNGSCTTAAPTTVVTIQQASGACGGQTVTAVNSLGPELASATIYQKIGTSCAPEAVPSGTIYFPFAAALDSSAFGLVVAKAE